MNGQTSRGVHAELYVRSLAPRGLGDRQDAVVETLVTLSAQGTLSEYTVYVCGEQAPASPAAATTEFGQYLLNRVAVFYEWADRNDCSLGSVFERRTVDSSILGERCETLVLPVMVLAEYEGEDLRFVAPCQTGGETITVQDRLDELRDGGDVDTDPLPNARASPPSTPLVH